MNSYEEILSDERSIINNIASLFLDETNSDINLSVGENNYPSHKFVLAASSQVFSRMFDRKWQTEREKTDDKETKILILEEDNDSIHVFQDFLRYFYTGTVAFSADKVLGLLCLADKYDVESLKILCEDYMIRHCASPHIDNAIKWYSYVKVLNLTEIAKECQLTISSNFDKLVNPKSKNPAMFELWLSLDNELIIEMLYNSSLVVENEYVIYQACLKWLSVHVCDRNYDNNDNDNSDHDDDDNNYMVNYENMERILEMVRFCQMTPRQLQEVEDKCEMSDNKIMKSIVKKLIQKAHKYRSMCLYVLPHPDNFTNDWYKPRNYLELTVDKLNTKLFNRFSNMVEKKSVKMPFYSDQKYDWKITYRKIGEKWSATIRSIDSSTMSNRIRVQFILLAVDNHEEIIGSSRSPFILCGPVTQETVDIDSIFHQDREVVSVVLLIKIAIGA